MVQRESELGILNLWRSEQTSHSTSAISQFRENEREGGRVGERRGGRDAEWKGCEAKGREEVEVGWGRKSD